MRYPLDIGPALVAARRARRMPQRELGDLIGVAQQQVARWEATGYRTASLERVDDVARALGVRSFRRIARPSDRARLDGDRVRILELLDSEIEPLAARLAEIAELVRAEFEAAESESQG